MLCSYVFLLPVWMHWVYPFCFHVLWLQMWPFSAPFSTLWLWPAYTVFVLSSSPGWVAFSLSSHPSPLRHNCHTVAPVWLITFSVTVTPPPLGLCWYPCLWAVGLLQFSCPAPQLPLLQWSHMFTSFPPYWRYNQAKVITKPLPSLPPISLWSPWAMGSVYLSMSAPHKRAACTSTRFSLSSPVSSHHSWIHSFSVYEMKPWKKLWTTH